MFWEIVAFLYCQHTGFKDCISTTQGKVSTVVAMPCRCCNSLQPPHLSLLVQGSMVATLRCDHSCCNSTLLLQPFIIVATPHCSCNFGMRLQRIATLIVVIIVATCAIHDIVVATCVSPASGVIVATLCFTHCCNFGDSVATPYLLCEYDNQPSNCQFRINQTI